MTAQTPFVFQFNGDINQKSAFDIKNYIASNVKKGCDAVWASIQCMGGDPASAAMLFEFIRGLPVPTWGHIEGAVFSASASFYLGFEHRTLSPTAKLGLHTATLTEPSRSKMDENWLRDQLSQVCGYNSQLIAQVEDAVGCDKVTAENWVRGCRFWVGSGAVDDGIGHEVIRGCPEFLHAQVLRLASP